MSFIRSTTLSSLGSKTIASKKWIIFFFSLCWMIPSQGQPDSFYYTWGPIPKQDASFNSSAVISGTLRDTEGNPVAGAEIFLDGLAMTKTDAQGTFRIEKEFTGYPKTWTILFKHASLTDVSRTYHPVMASTSYDITMSKAEACCRSTAFGILEMDFGFKKTTLDEDMKTRLASIAGKLRQNPTTGIELTAYGASGIENTVARYRQEAIRNYLIDEEGISAERISFRMEQEKKNTVQMRMLR